MSGCASADNAMHSTGTAVAVPPTHAELLRFLDDFTSSAKAIQAHNVTRLQALLHWWPEFTLHAMLSIFCNLPTTLTNTAMTASSNLHHHCEYDRVSEGATHTSGVAMEGHSYSLRQRQAAATVLRHLLRDQLTLTITSSEEVVGKARLFMRNDNVSFLGELLTQLLPMTACFDAEQGTRPVVLCHAASDLIILLLRLVLKRVHEATRHVQGSHTTEEDEGTTTTTTNNINSAVWPDFLRTLQTYLVQLLPYVTQQPVTQPGYASYDTPCATSPLVNVTLIRAAQAALLGLARLLYTLCEDKEVRQGIVEEQNKAAQAEGVVRLTELLRHMLHCLSTSLTTYSSNNTTTTPSVGVASPARNTGSADYYYTTTSNSSSVSECPAGWVEEYLCGLVESVLGACTAYLDDEENTLRVISTSGAEGTQKPRSVALPMPTPSLSAATNEDEEEQRHMPTTTSTTTETISGQSQRCTTTTTTTTITSNSVRCFLHALHDTLVHALLPFTQICLQTGRHEMAGAVLGAGCEAMRAFLIYVPHDYHDSMASCTQGEQTRGACEVTSNAFMTQYHQCSIPMDDVNAKHKREEEEDVERAQAQVTLLQVALPVVLQLWQVSVAGSNRVVEVQPSCHTALPRMTSTHTTHAPLQQQQHSTSSNDKEEEDALVSHPNREKAVQASLLCLTAIVPYLTEEALTCVMAAWVPTALSALHGLSCLSPRQLARLAKLESNTNNNNNNDNNGFCVYTASNVDGRHAACQAVAQTAVQQQQEEEEEEDFPVHVVEGNRGRHGRKAVAAVTRHTLSSSNGLVEEEDNNSEEEEDVVADECDGLHCLSATQHARRQSVNWLLNAFLSNAVLAELTRHALLQCSYTVLCEASQYIVTHREVTTSDTSTHQYENIYVSHATLEAAMMMLNECAEAMLRLSPTTTTTNTTPASCTLHTNTTSSSSNEVTMMSSEALLSAITTAVMQLLNTHLQSLTDTTTITTSTKKGCGVLPDYLGVPCVRWLTRLTLTASRVASHSNSHSSSDSPVKALAVALLAAVNGLPSLTWALVTLLQYEQHSAMQVEVIHGVEALMVNYLQHHQHSACRRIENEEENEKDGDEGSAQSVDAGSELETESDSDAEEGEEGEDEATRCVTAQTGPLPSSSHTLNAHHTTPFPTTTTASSSSETTSLAVLQECLVEMLRCLPRLEPAGRAALYALLAAVVPEWPTSSLLSNHTSSNSATVGPQTTSVSLLPSLLCALEALATQYNSVVSKTPNSLRAAASRIAEMAALLNCLCEVVPHIIMEEEGRGDIVIQSALPWLVQVCTREIAQYLFHDIHCANDTNSGGHININAPVSNTTTLVQSDAAYTKAGLSREEMCMLAVDLLGACCDALLDRQQLTLKTLLLLNSTTTNSLNSETRAKALYEALASVNGMVCDEVNTQSMPSCALPLWDAVLYIISSAFGMTPVVLHEGYHQCEVTKPSSLQQQHAHCPSNCANNVVVGGDVTMEERMQRMDFTTPVVGPGLRRACFSLLYDMVFLRTTFSSSSDSSEETPMLVKWMSNVASCCVYELNGVDSSAHSVQTDNRDTSVASAAMLCLAEVLHRCCVYGYDVQVILGSDVKGHGAGCHRECMTNNNNNSDISNSRDSREQLLQQQQQHDSYYMPHDAVSTPVMHTVDTTSTLLAAMKRYRCLYDLMCRRYCPTSEEEKAHTNSASHSVEVTERRNALLLISALYAFMVYVTEAVTRECSMPHTNTCSSSEENAWCCVSESDTRVFLHSVVPTARQLFATDALNNHNNNSNDMSSPFIASGNGMDYEAMQVWWNVGFALTHAFQHHQQQQCHLCNDAHGIHRMMPQDIHSMWNESAVVQQLKQLCLLVYRYGGVGSTAATASASSNLLTLWCPLARHVCAYDEAGGMGWLSAAERAMLSQ